MSKKNKKTISIKKYFTDVYLNDTIPILFNNKDSILFLATKTFFIKTLSEKKGILSLSTSKLPSDRSLYHDIVKHNNLKTQAFRQKLSDWYDKYKNNFDVQENIRDRPQDIRHYRSHATTVTKPGVYLQGDLMETTWLNPNKAKKRYNFLLVLVISY